MPKNTGRGTRHAAKTAHMFVAAKTQGGSFKGVTKSTCTCPTDAEIDAAIAANYRPAKPEGDTDV